MHMKNVGNASKKKENKPENRSVCMLGPNKQNEFRPNLAKNPTKQSNKPERNSIKPTKKATRRTNCFAGIWHAKKDEQG